MQYIFPKVSSISTELVIICVNVVIVILSAWLATLQIERRSILLLVAVLDNAGLRRHRFYHQSVSTSSERRVAIFSVSVFSEQHYHTVDQLDFHVHLYDFSTKRNDGIEKPRVQMIVLC